MSSATSSELPSCHRRAVCRRLPAPLLAAVPPGCAMMAANLCSLSSSFADARAIDASCWAPGRGGTLRWEASRWAAGGGGGGGVCGGELSPSCSTAPSVTPS